MKNLLKISLAILLFAIACCCNVEVPPGYYGMKMAPKGLTGDVLGPGRHPCHNRQKMILIDGKELTVTENLSILCSDDLNFKFDLKVRARTKRITKAKEFEELLSRKGSQLQKIQLAGGGSTDGRFISFDILYTTYIKPIARSTARGVVSKLQTTEIRGNRDKIEKEIYEKLVAAIEGTPIEVIQVTTSNFDYPDVITKAVEKKRQKEIEIDEEKATQAMELLKADNRLKLAQKMKIVRATEAEAEAVYVRILGSSLTSKYLELKEIEAKRALFEKTGAGDKVIVDGNVTPFVSTK